MHESNCAGCQDLMRERRAESGYRHERFGFGLMSGAHQAELTKLRDSTYYAQLARKARQLASSHSDPVVARHLREAAVKHDRRARQLARAEANPNKPKPSLKSLITSDNRLASIG